ncbi:phage tail protein [Enterococcus gallinarum]|uniref:phage tail protein n=1 Tax=Enterococcus gallinarum TaxID=1353 RepID=UPI0035C9B150
MYFRVIDENFNTLTSFLDEDMLEDEQWYTKQGSTYSITIPKSMEGSEHLIEDNMIAFVDENKKSLLFTIMNISYEDETIRTIECESFDVALIGDISDSYPSNKAQTIDYFINREIYNTVWEIRINELSHKTALPDCSGTGDTKKARLYSIAETFEAELDFVLEFNNAKLRKAYIDIYQQRGTDLSNSVVLRTGDDIETIHRTTDIYTTFTEIKVLGSGADISRIKYDDGTYYTTDGSNILYNRVAKKDRGGKKVMGYYSSDSSTPSTIFSEGLAYLKDNDEVKVNYEVSVIRGIDDYQVFDYVKIIDNEYNPAIRVKARVLEKTISRVDPSKNKAVFGNFVTLSSGISAQLKVLQKQLSKIEDRYTVNIMPNNGTGFIDGESKTTSLTATVFKENEDITNSLSKLDFFWYKVDKNGNHDLAWEGKAYGVGNIVSVSDIDFEEVAMITCSVNIHKNQWVQAIYFINGLKALAYRVEQQRTADTLVVPVITDTHYAVDVINKEDIRGNLKVFDHIKNFVEFTNMVQCDFALHLGDVVEGRSTKKQNTIDLQKVMALIGQVDCPYFISLGNHDDNRYGNRASGNVMNQFIEPDEMYKMITSPSKAFGIIENPSNRNMYYYYDVPDKNFRIFVLNSFDHPYTATNGAMNYIDYGGYRKEQINWLIDSLKQTPEDYTVAFFQHNSMGTGWNDSNANWVHNSLIVQGIIGAYKNGTSYSGSNTDKDFAVDVNVNFTGTRKVALIANGHHHADRLKVVNNINNLTINLSHPDPRIEYWDTLQQDCWDVLLIDTKNQKVKALRYGFGQDVEFSYS